MFRTSKGMGMIPFPNATLQTEALVRAGKRLKRQSLPVLSSDESGIYYLLR